MFIFNQISLRLMLNQMFKVEYFFIIQIHSLISLWTLWMWMCVCVCVCECVCECECVWMRALCYKESFEIRYFYNI